MHTNKSKPLITVYWFAFLLLFIILGMYGREAIEWVLIKLYEIFIEKNTGTV